MTQLSLACEFFIGCVLLLAGVAKATNRAALMTATKDFGFVTISTLLTTLLPATEIVLGLSLLTGILSWLSSFIALALFVVFAIIIQRSVFLGQDHECNCFGGLFKSRVSQALVYRNIAFTVMSAYTILVPQVARQEAAIAFMSLGVPQLTYILLAAMSVVCVIQLYLIVRLRRLEQVAFSNFKRSGTELPYQIKIGSILPNFVTKDLNGALRVWRDAVLDGPYLVVFVNPRCTSCASLLEAEEFLNSNSQLKTILISRGSAEKNEELRKLNGVSEVLLQDDVEISSLLGIRVTPTALVVSSTGKVLSTLLIGPAEIKRYMVGVVGNHDRIAEVVNISGTG